jgi:hypothetical protein
MERSHLQRGSILRGAALALLFVNSAAHGEPLIAETLTIPTRAGQEMFTNGMLDPDYDYVAVVRGTMPGMNMSENYSFSI